MRAKVKQNVELDSILTLQFQIAWAGEAQCRPTRLGWWQSDLVDAEGGGHFMSRLAPRTQGWAALQCVRRVAFLADSKARHQLPDPDSLRTLFFWGFEFDERLEERILQWKRSLTPPGDALKLSLEWNKDRFASYLEGLAEPPQSAGRELTETLPAKRSEAARSLARALLPLGPEYAAPFYRSKT